MHAQDTPFETTIPHAVLLDARTGKVLFEKGADTAVPPASMSKLMTMIMVFEALKAGKMTLDQEILDQRGCLAPRRCLLGRFHHVCRTQFEGETCPI